MKTYQLKIAHFEQETGGTKIIYLDVPDTLRDVFKYKPGQYLNVEMEVAGETIQQSYSLCSSPNEERLAFPARWIDDDLLSCQLNSRLQVNDSISVSSPQGEFVHVTDPERRATYYLIAGDEGITPLFSLLKSILEMEPLSTVHLLVENEIQSNLIYQKTLYNLAEIFVGQLHMRYFLWRPNKNQWLMHWDGTKEKITRRTLGKYLTEYPAQTLQEKFFICGPDRMIEELSGYLFEQGKEKNQISVEQLNKITMEITQDKSFCQATIQLDGESIDIEIKEQTVLQTLIDAGYDPPFSCTSGVCTTCMAKLTKGKVEMEANYGLDEGEVAEGYILTCQSHPKSDEIELTYDV